MKSAWILLVFLLSACSASQPGCAPLPGGETYCLRGRVGAPEFSTLQKIHLSLGSQDVLLISRIESDEKGLRMLGMTPFGQTIMSISWENGRLIGGFQEALAGKINPAALLALVQIALWPAAEVRNGLGSDWILIEEHQRRRLRLANGDNNPDMLDISWEGILPYSKLVISAPSLDFRMVAVQLNESGDHE